MEKGFVTAIILAAGTGSRMGAPITKQRMILLGESVLKRTVRAFEECPLITSIIVAVKEDEKEFAETELSENFSKITKIVIGGKCRAESAKLAFSEIPENTEYVAIHDGARCLITPEMIEKVIASAKACGAATAGSLVTDTVKHLDEKGNVDSTLDRNRLFFATTPQIFKRELYERAISEISDISTVTDDNMLIERLGERVCAVDLGKENIKITTMEDISYAEYLLAKRKGEKMGQTRVGHGYDVHKFAEGRELILGGVKVPYEKGLLGHSDADVLTHAIMDALLGAAALGDIGRHFPDTAEEYRGISSILLLKRVKELVNEKGYEIVNIDATLLLQKPKIAAYVDSMIENIAGALEISPDCVNIKATTEEKLGFTGSGEGAAAHTVALIKK